MQDITAIRLVDDRLAWYPPGAGKEPEWLDDEAAQERLLAALAQRRSGVCFAAPGADTRLLSLPVSAGEKKHIAKSLPFTLEEQVAADIEDLHFSHSTLDRETIGVAICSRDKMQDWHDLLSDFPGVRRWAPEPLLLPWTPGQWCLVLEGDSAIIRTGQCEGCTIERGLADVVLQALVSESEPPESVVVYGADQSSDLALLPPALDGKAQWRRGGFYDALLLSRDADVSLNLLQGDFAERLPLGRWWREWRIVAAGFAIAFALQLVALYTDYRELRAENLALRTAVQDSYRRAFPQGQVVDAEKQLRRQLDALRGSAQSSGFVNLVARVGEAMSKTPNTSIATLNYNDKTDEMRLNIIAGSFEGVESLRSAINASGLQAVMESSNAQGDKVRARLRVGGGTP
ncbi:MAG: type II secretion system protein GspL [Halioglobus sp.]|nr:type II secretion system protein GspL [Halioglobus sp.]